MVNFKMFSCAICMRNHTIPLSQSLNSACMCTHSWVQKVITTCDNTGQQWKSYGVETS